ncbi:MAG: class I SAM-dependent methyltransferase [SAR86 cluster bacterium]|nr:class I SAM-dependent methyltransferase [SAR86 cluster bacterium]
MNLKLPFNINKVKGFLDPKEGDALYSYAKQYSISGSCLEIGSYCGKSAVYLGMAVKENGQKLYSVDHHKGSEEQQPGEEYFDPDLKSKDGDGIDTLPFFLDTIEKSKLQSFVIPIVSTSEEAYEDLDINFDMIFIDGGHSEEAAQKDYDLWAHRINIGGILAIHDVFPNPKDGGRPPYNIYIKALESGNFEELEVVKSLRLLRKIK